MRNFDDFNQKILITFHADNYKVSKRAFLLWFFLMVLLLLIIIAVVTTVSVIFTKGSSVTISCINPISVYKSGICKTNCKYGATIYKQKCNPEPQEKPMPKVVILTTTAPATPTTNTTAIVTTTTPAITTIPTTNTPATTAVTTTVTIAPIVASDCGQESIYKDGECKYCLYGIADNEATCNKLCGLYTTTAKKNEKCYPANGDPYCKSNTKILNNTENGGCTYKASCVYTADGVQKYRITESRNQCNEVCITYNNEYNIDYAKSNNVFTWTKHGECVKNCPYGPALVPNTNPKSTNSLMPAYKNPAIVDPKCNAECFYLGQTNSIDNGNGYCVDINSVCHNPYIYNQYLTRNYTKATPLKTNLTRNGLANITTDVQILEHGCNEVCKNTYISANTISGKCAINCTNGVAYFSVLDSEYNHMTYALRCNCPGDSLHPANNTYFSTYLGTYKKDNMRYCNSQCNYSLSINTDNGGCVPEYYLF